MAENLGQKLKALREHRGFTQSNIANYLKVDLNFLVMVEEGKGVLTSEMIDKLGALFFVDISSIQEADLEKESSFTLRVDGLNEEDLEAIASINRIALNIRLMKKLLPANLTSK